MRRVLVGVVWCASLACAGRAERELDDARSVIAFFLKQEAAAEARDRRHAARRRLRGKGEAGRGAALSHVHVVRPNVTEGEDLTVALNRVMAVAGSAANASRGLYDGRRLTLRQYFARAKRESEDESRRRRAAAREARRRRRGR